MLRGWEPKIKYLSVVLHGVDFNDWFIGVAMIASATFALLTAPFLDLNSLKCIGFLCFSRRQPLSMA